MAQQDVISGFPLLSEGKRLMQADKLDQAAQAVMRHLRQHPNEPRGLAELGAIAMRLGALCQSEQFLRQALARGNKDFEVRRNLASVLNQQERLEEARTLFESLAKESSDPTLSALLAIILEKLGRNDQALALHEELTAKHGNRPHFWIGYGHNLRANGRSDDAVAAYRKAIEVDEECGEAWWGIASIKKLVFTDADIEAMRAALKIAIDVRNLAPLHFALARALHDRGQYEEAFEHYSEGNHIRAEDLRYDSRELTDEVATIERTVGPDFFKATGGSSKADVVPIFIISLPRSGSTLLEQMLGSHPSIEAIGELPYIPAILRSAMELSARHQKLTVPELVTKLTDQQAEALGKEYLKRAALHRKMDRKLFVDKLPHNWSNVIFIKRILPQARFIDIRRNPMDCCFSNFTQSFSSAHASSFALKDIGQSYVDYTRLMDHLDKVAPDLIHHVRYEQLIEEAETELRKIFAYLGVEWSDAPLNFHQLDRVVRTPSAEQVRRPLNREGVDVWQPYSDKLAELRAVLGPLAEA